MPELPEVETTLRGLARHMLGERIIRVETRRPDLRRPFPRDLKSTLEGQRIERLSRRAKYGLLHLDGGQSLVFHLGMSGRWRIDPKDENAHDHLVIETSAHRFVLTDPRRFGSVDLIATDRLDSWPPFARLGPEPLEPAFNAAVLARALAGSRRPIKLALLDQRIVAGLGNIYVCEALWHARIHPESEAGAISRRALGRLVTAIRAVLERAIADGGSSLRDYARPDGELGYFSTRFAVYGRTGEPCLRGDGAAIRQVVQAQRSSWFCPRCQRRRKRA